jgi:hypothetical protein
MSKQLRKQCRVALRGASDPAQAMADAERFMPLYLEELQVGQRFSSGEYQMTD